MHEMSLMEGVFARLEEKIEELELTEVTAVKLKVGQLTAAVPGALEFAFNLFARGTVVEGADLIIEEVPVTILCRECRQKSRPEEDYNFICPRCSSTSTKITAGRELIIDYLEAEEG